MRPGDYARFHPVLAEHACLPVGDPRRTTLRSALVLAFLPVAEHLARRYAVEPGTSEELTQAGVLGVLHAIDHWDPDSAPDDVLSYLVPCVRGEILHHIRDRTWAMRVTRPVKELVVALDRAVGPLTQRLGRAPRPSELAEELGLATEEVVEALAARADRRGVSLDRAPGDGPDLAELIGEADPELAGIEFRESLWPVLQRLPERERRIVLLRFFGNKTQAEIGELVGVSQMHVSRLLARALRTLRDGLRDEPEPPGR
ncbi:sigma-70 family RNA polymerase sigma factor [Pseudonocardia sp. RS010]|uniref:sigma-70 family RNA polymerase sigma factor n=1 Tax=Pseudonocardia sp. RS010 TaxID=3385979 RepID=UPI0039A0F6B2